MALIEEKEEANELDGPYQIEDSLLAKLQRFLVDAAEQNVSLQKTPSFHQQCTTAITDATGYLEEVERRLEDIGSGESFEDQIEKLQVCVSCDKLLGSFTVLPN